MNISEIKQQLGYSTLGMNTVTTATGEQTSWMKHWDNERRIAVLIHKDTLAKLNADLFCNTLGLNTQVKQGSKGEYTAHTIVMYKPAEVEI